RREAMTWGPENAIRSRTGANSATKTPLSQRNLNERDTQQSRVCGDARRFMAATVVVEVMYGVRRSGGSDGASHPAPARPRPGPAAVARRRAAPVHSDRTRGAAAPDDTIPEKRRRSVCGGLHSAR